MSETVPDSREGTQPEAKNITRRQSVFLLVASVLTALSALLVTVIAKARLESIPLEEFLIFWSLLFSIYGIVVGMQQETTRAVGSARLKREQGDQRGVRVILPALTIGSLVGALVLLSSPLWASRFLPTNTTAAIILLALGVALYALHTTVLGAAAGRESWSLFAAISGGEALWRLLAMLLVALTVGSLLGFEVAVVSAVLLWALYMIVWPEARAAFGERADVATGPFVQRLLWAMGSSAASSVLMMGFPVVLKISQGDGAGEDSKILLAMLILAISICRSPIMIPLHQFQGVAISAFLKQKHRPIRAMAKPSLVLLGVGLVGAVAAGLVGPWLFRLIYPPKVNELAVYDQYLTGWLLGALVFASAVLALLVLSGTAVIALDAHRLYVLGWVVAASLAIALAFLPLPLVARTLIALYAGPAAGFAVHLTGMVLLARKK